jgi:8-oxo-dGTP diphosphatase
MKHYVAGFMFSPDLENVVLIEKQKPDWQKGKYNAVGGKIEEGESPIQAMVREFEEEAFVSTKNSDWMPLCIIGTDDYEVVFFYCIHKKWRDYLTKTDEEVFHVPVMDLHLIRHQLIDNLNWLIPLCIDKANNYSGEIRTTQIYPLLVRN